MSSASGIIDWCVDRRCRVFIILCFLVHAVYMVAFALLGLNKLLMVDSCSTIFYGVLALTIKKNSPKAMLLCFYEIILFAAINENMLGIGFGFFLFVMGMISVLFYLAPELKNKRFIHQFIGIVLLLVFEHFAALRMFVDYSLRGKAVVNELRFFGANVFISVSLSVLSSVLFSRNAEQAMDKLEYNMKHDELTGLYNRRAFETWMHENMQSQTLRYAVALIDIDNFKKVNDTYGHHIGDVTLQMLSQKLKKYSSEDVIPIRWGGEEFILIFRNKSSDEVMKTLNDLRIDIISQAIDLENRRKLSITVTMGVAYGIKSSSYEHVIRKADEKLYKGKNSGKNCIVV